MKVIKYLIGVSVFAYAIYWLNQPNETPLETPQHRSQIADSVSPTNHAQAQSIAQPVNIDVTDFQHCNGYLRKLEQYANDWIDNQYMGWDAYLEMGYSIDDIVMAVEHYQGTNLAIEYKARFLRRNTELTKYKNELNAKAKALQSEPGFIGVRYMKTSPNEKLNGFAQKSMAEKTKIALERFVTVDDIALLLQQSDFSNGDLIVLINALAHPAAIVSVERLDEVSILDVAAHYNRIEVVEHLFDLGITPTQDSYLPSTFEHALYAVYTNSLMERDNTKAVSLIKRLSAMGHSARLSEQSELMVKANLPRLSFKFDSQMLEALKNNYDLDLTKINLRPLFEVDANNSLITTIEQEKQAELAKHFGENQQGAIATACNETITMLKGLWQKTRIQELVARTKSTFGDDPDVLIAQLAKLDPALVDFHIEMEAQRLNQVKIENERPTYTTRDYTRWRQLADEAYEYFRRGQPVKAIQHALAEPVPESTKHSLLFRMLEYGPDYVDEIINSPLTIEPLDYSGFKLQTSRQVKLVKAIVQSGYNLDQADNNGRSLLYYAALNYRDDIVDLLFENQFSFSFSPYGSDPLHIALRRNNIDNPLPKNFESMIEKLMQFEPEIDRFHLSRMKVLSLYFPRSYQQLVTKFPQLHVKGDTALPPI